MPTGCLLIAFTLSTLTPLDLNESRYTHGVEIGAAADITIVAEAYGLNFKACGDIDVASNNVLGAFGGCHSGAPDLVTEDHVRLFH